MTEQNRDPYIMKSSNITGAEFKTLVIKMLNELLGGIDTSKKRDKNGNGNYKREPV